MLASAVRNCCSVAVESLELPLLDVPNADSRFWKSLSNVLAVDDVPVLVLVESVVVEALAVESVDVLLELDVSDCARLSSADARSLP